MFAFKGITSGSRRDTGGSKRPVFQGGHPRYILGSAFLGCEIKNIPSAEYYTV
jgi:hypothetical protein